MLGFGGFVLKSVSGGQFSSENAIANMSGDRFFIEN